MEGQNYKVYMHKNKLNNKIYIGITKQKLSSRWGLGSGYLYQPYFYNAIQCYGWNNFEHKVLFNKLTKVEAEIKEIELIKFYNSNKKEFGYNITGGGKGTNGVPCSDEKKSKISKANMGHPVSQELREHFRQLKLGKKPINCKKILCIETNIIYESMHEAERQTGAKFKNISKVCQNAYGRKTAGGYHWQYYELDKIEDKKEEESK